MKLGPGGVQNWAGDIIAVLREAHKAVEEARARGISALDAIRDAITGKPWLPPLPALA
jgi:hypothetical protein